jgi:hypothetical protein
MLAALPSASHTLICVVPPEAVGAPAPWLSVEARLAQIGRDSDSPRRGERSTSCITATNNAR